MTQVIHLRFVVCKYFSLLKVHVFHPNSIYGKIFDSLSTLDEYISPSPPGNLLQLTKYKFRYSLFWVSSQVSRMKF